jgi:purine-binding chemotaxis protein CheW
MDKRWAALSQGVHRLDGKLLIVLNVDATLSLTAAQQAA